MKGLFLDDIDLKRLRDIVESVQKTYEISSTDLTSFSDELERNQKLIENHGISDQKRSTPCYKGWTFCWILANGDVVPCCDCNIPLGNINNETFESIWYSKKYYELRRSMTTPHRGIINISACKCDTCKPDSEEIRISKGLQFIRGRGFRRKAI
jgi:MoaA/NifB/PqqE/SkfB family radical SAM enzyme